MNYKSRLFCYLLLLLPTGIWAVEDQVELETTFIKGNKELPQILYVVPWKDMKHERHKEEIIVLHSLFGDVFNPVGPEEFTENE